MIMKNKIRIDWDNIKIKIVPADKEHPNELNPYGKFSAKEREQVIVSVCGRIWARSMKERLLKDKSGK